MNQAMTQFQNQAPVEHRNTTDMVLDYQAMEQMSRLADMMANGRATVPQHLQGNPADCMAVIMQAAQWRMNPFAVAQKTHVVQGTLGYEAQLVNAVVCSSTKVKDSFHYEWFGDWTKVIGNFVTKTSQKAISIRHPTGPLLMKRLRRSCVGNTKGEMSRGARTAVVPGTGS